jgi:hypothetical protein
LVDGPAQKGGFQWMYALLGLCFVALAIFRLDEGAALWAAVFGLAALAYAYLSVRFVLPTRLGGMKPQEAGQSGPASAPSEPTPAEMSQTLRVYESRARGWLAISVAGWLATVGVVLLTPPLALVSAALSLFSTYRFRRCRRSVRILRRALVLEGPKERGEEHSG